MSESAPLIPSKVKTQDDADEILENAVTNAYIGFLDDNDDEEEEEDDEVIWLREQRDHNKSLPWTKRPSILLVSLVILVVAFATSLAEPSRASLTFKLACSSVSGGDEVCDPNQTQMLVSNLQIFEQISNAIVVIFSSGRIGGLSDQYGRKLFIALILGLMLVGRAIGFVAFISSSTLPFVTLILSGVVFNISGGLLTIVALINLYISDVSEAHERIYSLGISIAALYVGLSVGPVFGSLLTTLPLKFSHNNDKSVGVSTEDPILSAAFNVTAATKKESPNVDFLPLKFEMGILVVVCLYTYFLLPESRSPKAIHKSRSMSRTRLQLELRSLNLGENKGFLTVITNSVYLMFSFLKPLRLLWVPADCIHPLRRHRLVKDRIITIMLVLLDCILTAVGMSLGQILVMYGIYKFEWKSNDIGHFMAIACLLRAAILIVLSPIISHTIFHKLLKQKIFKKQVDMVDWSTAFLGLVLESIAFGLMYFNKSTAGLLALMVMASFGAIFNPAVNSAVVKIFPESKIGEYFGAMSLLKNIFSLLSPLVFISVYKRSLTIRNDASLYFLVISSINAICCVLFFLIKSVGDLDTEDLALTPISRSNSLIGPLSRRSSTVSDTVSSIDIPSPHQSTSGRMLSQSQNRNALYQNNASAIV